jgi:putative transposase
LKPWAEATKPLRGEERARWEGEVSFWRLFYHLVWATKGRQPLIEDERLVVIERSIRSTSLGMGAVLHAIGSMPDHVHVAVSIPPRIAISSFVQQVKGESSHLLNHAAGHDGQDWFRWQPQYGAVSFGERSLAQGVAYVENQRAHHAADHLWPLFEIAELPRPIPTNAGSSPAGASSPQPRVSTLGRARQPGR